MLKRLRTKNYRATCDVCGAVQLFTHDKGYVENNMRKAGWHMEETEGGTRHCCPKHKAIDRKKSKYQVILNSWDAIEDVDPDISTEQLFARVMDETGYDEGDICEALASRE